MDVNEMILKLMSDGLTYAQAKKDVESFESDMNDIEIAFMEAESVVYNG